MGYYHTLEGNPGKLTYKRRKRFLQHLEATGNIGESARRVGVSRQALYEARRRFPRFKQAWDDAREAGWDRAEAEAMRRAVDGVPEPVYYKGDVVGEVQKYSDQLLGLILRGNRPEQYNRQVIDQRVTGAGGGALIINMTPKDEAAMLEAGVDEEEGLDGAPPGWDELW